ncbi:hypothetical protein AB0J82_15430 [Asanoa sp. NPDC049518]|uniref:hypothetical protein n=1 Tax=unclassified Asanoa TaxID=2685164 RepID=UPI00341EDF60
MIATTRPRYRPEALAAYRDMTVGAHDEGVGPPPRWPLPTLLVVVGLLVLGAGVFRAPVYVAGVAVAIPGRGMVALVPGVPDAGVAEGAPAALVPAAGPEIPMRVGAVTVVADRAAARAHALPPDLDLPVTVVELVSGPRPAPALAGGQVRITAANPTLLGRWLAGVRG